LSGGITAVFSSRSTLTVRRRPLRSRLFSRCLPQSRRLLIWNCYFACDSPFVGLVDCCSAVRAAPEAKARCVPGFDGVSGIRTGVGGGAKCLSGGLQAKKSIRTDWPTTDACHRRPQKVDGRDEPVGGAMLRLEQPFSACCPTPIRKCESPEEWRAIWRKT
jgi:hypothetical protein